MLIDSVALRSIAKTIPPKRAELLAALLSEICPLYKINTVDILHEFLANVLHESGEFNTYKESLNYSVDALIAKFGRHRISISQARQYGRTSTRPANQKAIANTLYGGKWGRINLGNIQPDDGWDFRGAGPIQITGRANLTGFFLYMKTNNGFAGTIQELAELVRTDDRIAIHSACWIFAVAKNLIQAAVDDKIKEITKKINGALMGFSERLKYYELCKKYLPEN